MFFIRNIKAVALFTIFFVVTQNSIASQDDDIIRELMIDREHVAKLNTSDANIYLNVYLQKMKRFLKKEFLFMADETRVTFLEIYNDELQFVLDFCITYNEEYSLLKLLAYDCILLSKGLLLNYSRLTDNAVATCGNNEIKHAWKELKKMKRDYYTLLEWLEYVNTVFSVTFVDKTSLSILKNQLLKDSTFLEDYQYCVEVLKNTTTWIWDRENEIFKFLRSKSDSLPDIFPNVNLILKELTTSEAAIEIVSAGNIKNMNEYRKKFYALILHPQLVIPYIVELPENINGSSLFYQNAYTPEEIYSALWYPIIEVLPKNTHTIYIAQGNNVLPVSGVKKKNGISIEEEFKIHSILSTKDIFRIKKNKTKISFPDKNSALLVGGIDYWFEPKIEDTDSNRSKDQDINIDSGLEIALQRGQGFDYLPGSTLEVSTISVLMEKHGWSVTLLDNEQATEKQITEHLDDYSPTVIHISSHAFYFPQSSKKPDLTYVSQYPIDEYIAKNSTNPLLRTGILCSGGNQAWSENYIYEPKIGDGLLTAMEISYMDITGTHLVVLSACNTGLGEMVTNEGLYGLMRAFKLAGVDTMIVTVCKIPDESVVDFMKVFYTEWLSGIDISDAFTMAQNCMKGKYPDEPEKWASFLLIE